MQTQNTQSTPNHLTEVEDLISGEAELLYRQYEVQRNEWVVVPLDERLIGRRGNMMNNLSRIKTARITAEDRRKPQIASHISYKVIVAQWNQCGGQLNITNLSKGK